MVIDNRAGRTSSGSIYYGSIEDELEARMLLLKEIGEFADVHTDPDQINIHDLERRVLEYIESEAS